MMEETKQKAEDVRCIFSRTRPRSPISGPIRIITENVGEPICAMACNAFLCDGKPDEQKREKK